MEEIIKNEETEREEKGMIKLDLIQSRLFGRVCYGYEWDEKGFVYVNPEKADVVKVIFHMATNNHSLQDIQAELLKRDIKSPSGKDKWTRDVIDKTINNKKYVPFIISFEDYLMARGEKELRCRYDRELSM